MPATERNHCLMALLFQDNADGGWREVLHESCRACVWLASKRSHLDSSSLWWCWYIDDDIWYFDNSLQMYQRIIVSWKTGTLRSKSMAQIRKGRLVKGPYKLNYCIRGFSNEHLLLPSSSLLCFCTLILSVSQPQQSNTPPKFHMDPPQKKISAGKGGHFIHFLDTIIFRFHLKLQGCFFSVWIFAALSLNDLQEKPELVDGTETQWLVDVKIPNALLMRTFVINRDAHWY